MTGEKGAQMGKNGDCRGHILLVDDESDLIENLQYRLETLHYNIISARDGLDAVSKAITEKPDLILLDIVMPVMDGYEVCSQLKKNPSTKNIPIVILTALSSEKDQIKAHEMGADDYIAKPFEIREVLSKIQVYAK